VQTAKKLSSVKKLRRAMSPRESKSWTPAAC
jgi:hypothetical protein